MKKYESEADIIVGGVSVGKQMVTVVMPEYEDYGMIHGGTSNARARENDLGKERADSLVKTLRTRRRRMKHGYKNTNHTTKED